MYRDIGRAAVGRLIAAAKDIGDGIACSGVIAGAIDVDLDGALRSALGVVAAVDAAVHGAAVDSHLHGTADGRSNRVVTTATAVDIARHMRADTKGGVGTQGDGRGTGDIGQVAATIDITDSSIGLQRRHRGVTLNSSLVATAIDGTLDSGHIIFVASSHIADGHHGVRGDDGSTTFSTTIDIALDGAFKNIDLRIGNGTTHRFIGCRQTSTVNIFYIKFRTVSPSIHNVDNNLSFDVTLNITPTVEFFYTTTIQINDDIATLVGISIKFSMIIFI